MAKNQLLAETDPKKLREIALASFLSFFVFLGAFATADSALLVFYNSSSGLITCAGCPVVSREPTSGPGYGTTWKGNQDQPGPNSWERPCRDCRQYGDYDKNGRVDPQEDRRFKAEQAKKSGQSGGSGSGNTSAPPTKSLNSDDANCLKLGGCGAQSTDI